MSLPPPLPLRLFATSFTNLGSLFAVAAAAALLAGCAGRVETEVAPGFHYRPGGTYAWAEHAAHDFPGEKDYQAQDPILHERLQRALDDELARKGLKRVNEAAQADYAVHYHLGVVNRSYVTGGGGVGFYGGYGHHHHHGYGGFGWGGYGPPEYYYRKVRYREGTLLFDLADRASGRLLFRAVGTKPVDSRDITDQGVKDAVAELLEDLETGR